MKLGFSKREIEGLLDRARLHPLHRAVYAVGHDKLTTKGCWMAAVLACGPNAFLSHKAAIALHELRPVPGGPTDVTVPGRTRHSRKAIRVHNVRSLHDDDRDTVNGIPATSLHRTLLDYAEGAGSSSCVTPSTPPSGASGSTRASSRLCTNAAAGTTA